MSLEIVRKKLSIRSWRRGTKELDLILGRFSDENITKLEISELDLYEQFLSKDDHLIYGWLFEKKRVQKSLRYWLKRYKGA